MTGRQHQQLPVSDRTKLLLADPLKRIKLDDFINAQLRTAIAALSLEHFPTHRSGTNEEFARRISAYETAVGDLATIVILLARWGNREHLLLLEKSMASTIPFSPDSGSCVAL